MQARIVTENEAHRTDFTVRKEGSETATKAETLAMEIKLIDPAVGYNLTPRWTSDPT